MVKHNNPDFIIPFKKTKDECILAYKKKVSKFFFAPKYMKSDIIVNKFRGIYLPYCVYKASFHGKNTNTGTKYSGRVGDYKYYNDYKISADVDADYEGISYDLISNFYDKFSHSIPHNYKEAEPFNSSYLAGFYADSKDVTTSTYEDLVTSLAKADSTNYLLKRKEFNKYGCYCPSVNFQITDKKIGMFPVYFLAIRDKKNIYVNYAVVNGQTGKVVADLPIDFKKYILVSILLAIPIFLLINNLLVLTPKSVCVFSIISSTLSIIISIYQTKKIHERQNHLDDIGYKQEESKFEYKTITKVKTADFKITILTILFILSVFSIPVIYMNSINIGLYVFFVFFLFILTLTNIIKSSTKLYRNYSYNEKILNSEQNFSFVKE